MAPGRDKSPIRFPKPAPDESKSENYNNNPFKYRKPNNWTGTMFGSAASAYPVHYNNPNKFLKNSYKYTKTNNNNNNNDNSNNKTNSNGSNSYENHNQNDQNDNNNNQNDKSTSTISKAEGDVNFKNNSKNLIFLTKGPEQVPSFASFGVNAHDIASNPCCYANNGQRNGYDQAQVAPQPHPPPNNEFPYPNELQCSFNPYAPVHSPLINPYALTQSHESETTNNPLPVASNMASCHRAGSEVAAELSDLKPYKGNPSSSSSSSASSSSSTSSTRTVVKASASSSSVDDKTLALRDQKTSLSSSSRKRPRDARAIIEARRNPQRHEPDVVEEVIQDYSTPRHVREMQLTRQLRSDKIVDTIKQSAYMVRTHNKVRGDDDDEARYRRYLNQGKTLTAHDFGGCKCKGKGVQIWIRLCGCGCRCSRCRACVRYFDKPKDTPDDFEDLP